MIIYEGGKSKSLAEFAQHVTVNKINSPESAECGLLNLRVRRRVHGEEVRKDGGCELFEVRRSAFAQLPDEPRALRPEVVALLVGTQLPEAGHQNPHA